MESSDLLAARVAKRRQSLGVQFPGANEEVSSIDSYFGPYCFCYTLVLCNNLCIVDYRWVKLRTSLLPVTALLEPVSECLALGVVGSWAVSVVFTWSPLAFFFVHVLIWFLLDYTLLHIVQVGSVAIGWRHCLECMCVTESACRMDRFPSASLSASWPGCFGKALRCTPCWKHTVSLISRGGPKSTSSSGEASVRRFGLGSLYDNESTWRYYILSMTYIYSAAVVTSPLTLTDHVAL